VRLPWGHNIELLDKLDTRQSANGTPRLRSNTAGPGLCWPTRSFPSCTSEPAPLPRTSPRHSRRTTPNGPTAASDAGEAVLAHRAFDAFVVHLSAEPESQLGSHRPAAMGAEVLIVDLADQLAEVGIGEHSRGRVRVGMSPGLERRSRHLHRAHTLLER
jgi:hypothetical protein